MTTQLPAIADIPALFIFDAAVGVYTLDELCAKYEYPPEYAAYLEKEPAFQKAVREQEAELDKTGVSFKIRSGLVAEEAMMIIRDRIKRGDTPTPVVLDAFKTMAKFAGREPAPAGQQAAPGSGFSITINIPQMGTTPASTMTLDSVSTRVADTAEIEVDPEYEYY
jgi:hypothetical protein